MANEYVTLSLVLIIFDIFNHSFTSWQCKCIIFSWALESFLVGIEAEQTLLLLTTRYLMYLCSFLFDRYGWIFLYETYLYHIVRKDIRHNFSPYFYLLYLTSDHEETSYFIKFLVFLPQLLLLLFIAFRFHGDVPLCTFLCTFSFVMFNKVCTSQVWTFIPSTASSILFWYYMNYIYVHTQIYYLKVILSYTLYSV